MSHDKQPDHFIQFAIGCPGIIGLWLLIATLVTWLNPW